MATNPLLPYAEIVAGDSESLTTPVGVASSDPFARQPLSQAAWDMMNPQQQADYLAEVLTSEADGGGSDDNFNDDAGLDRSQVYSQGAPPVSQIGQNSQGEWNQQIQPPPIMGPDDGDNSIHEFTKDGSLTKEQLAQRRKALAELAPKPQGGKLDAESRRILGAGPKIKEDAGFMDFVKAAWEGVKSGRFQPVYEEGRSPDDFPEVPDTTFRESDQPYVTSPDGKPIGVLTGLQEKDASEWTQGKPQVPTANDYAGVPATQGQAQQVSVVAPAPKPNPGMEAAIRAMASLRQPSTSPAEFVRTVWGADNVPAFAEEQLRTGRVAQLNEARPGDLVARVDDKGQPHLLGVYLKDGQFVADAGGQFAKRSKREYADKIFAVRVGERDRSRSKRGGVDLSPASQSRLARDVSEGFDSLADSLADLFSGGKKKKDSDRKGGGKKKSNKKKGGNRDKGSKFYGSEKKDSGNSSKKYSGIGATK